MTTLSVRHARAVHSALSFACLDVVAVYVGHLRLVRSTANLWEIDRHDFDRQSLRLLRLRNIDVVLLFSLDLSVFILREPQSQASSKEIEPRRVFGAIAIPIGRLLQ